jgi:hypothetical protein
LLPSFDQHTLETPLPKRSGAFEAAVHEDGDALLEFLEKDGKIGATSFIAGQDPGFPTRAAAGTRPLELRGNLIDRIGTVKQGEPPKQQLRSQRRERFAIRNLEEQMEVIFHEAIGRHTDVEKALEFPENRPEHLLFRRVKDKTPVNDSRNTVIK